VHAAGREAVDGHDVLAHLRDTAEQPIAEQPHVAAYASEHTGDGQAVDRAVRMVRHHEQRAAGRHAIEIRGRPAVDIDPQLRQRVFRKGRGIGRRRGCVVQPLQGAQPGQRIDRAHDEARSRGREAIRR
jgi:hypothetical protein